jgi:hypothetical protein
MGIFDVPQGRCHVAETRRAIGRQTGMIKRLPAILLIVAAVGVAAAGYFLWASKPPAGVARFRLPGPKGAGVTATPYSGKAALPLTVSYSGHRTIFEWNTQTWLVGKPNPITAHGLENLDDARQQATFSIQDRLVNGKPYYAVAYSFRRSSLLGGSSTGSGSFSESIPDQTSPWIATLALQGPVDLADGSSVSLWGIVGHRERLNLPPDSPLEAWASKADWAILIRVRLDR